MNESESFVRDILVDKGFQVERIPRKETKTADWLVSDERFSYVVEVTSKAPDAEWQRLLRRSTEAGHASETRPLEYSNLLDGILGKKAEQIRNTPTAQDAFSVIWIDSTPGASNLLRGILKRTLYGISVVADRRPNSTFGAAECFYYDHFLYYKHRDINCTISGDAQGLQMFVNPLCASASQFRLSALYELFADDNAVVDPERSSENAEICLELGVDRSSEESKLESLSRKYGIDAISMGPWNRFQFVATVPKDLL